MPRRLPACRTVRAVIPVIFDLDGTLLHSAPDIHRVANLVLGPAGVGTFTLDEVTAAIGSGVSVLVTRLAALRGLALEPERHRGIVANFTALYEDSHDLTRPYPGVLDALTALAAAGHPLGLCTNKPHRPALAALRHFDLTDTFATVVGGDSLPQRKPDPAPLRHTMSLLGASRALYVGDSEVDAETAAAAGVPFVLFTEGYRKTPREELPHAAWFSDFSDLPALVARISA